MLHIFFNYTELHRLKEAVFVLHMVNVGGELCRGIQIRILNRDLFQPILVVLHILAKVQKSHPGKLEFSEKIFDRLAGNSWIREGLLQGQSVDQITKRWQPSLKEFKKKREKYLLYR